MTSLPPIHIIGAGIGGLTLARCFRNRGIHAVIFEKKPSPAYHNYGISLQPWAWRLLVKECGIGEGDFRKRVAVDAVRGGRGKLGGKSVDERVLRAHRGRLEGLLREGVDAEVRWGHVLQSITLNGNGKGQTLTFKDESDVKSAFVVDTSGVHSQVRKSLLPDLQLNVLPYVVFRGTRRIEMSVFKQIYEKCFGEGNIIQTKTGDILLQIWINDVKDESEGVDISIIYSRPSKDNDPLHRPGRDLNSSSDISEAFFEEVSQLKDLEQLFKDAFEDEKVRKGRTLHWLMRDVLVPKLELERLGKEGVVLIGDSAHALPILGGEGANFAIRDAVLLADSVKAAGEGGRGLDVDLDGFYGRVYREWEDGIGMGEERLREMHKGGKSSL
ncbi:hypothetical protein VTL71DRAFT_11887 [Oculimacula yallundae]|uniref:FAD-binding domain-containing protein n=1 Tax=Oculimacula yallundae TaxID=86028 RepID=A0ABR4CTZ2_9HELO